MNTPEYLTWLQSVTPETEFNDFASYVRENLTPSIGIIAYTTPSLLPVLDTDEKFFEQAIMTLDSQIMLSNRLPSSVFLNIPDRSPIDRLLLLMCKSLQKIYSMKKVFIYASSTILKIVRSFKNGFKI